LQHVVESRHTLRVMCAGAAVESFGVALFEHGGNAAMCSMLQDRVNTLLSVGHAAVLGACGQGARVHLVPDGMQDSQVLCPVARTGVLWNNWLSWSTTGLWWLQASV
jgi:hypothetical protein